VFTKAVREAWVCAPCRPCSGESLQMFTVGACRDKRPWYQRKGVDCTHIGVAWVLGVPPTREREKGGQGKEEGHMA
jgi:hypothetical protein